MASPHKAARQPFVPSGDAEFQDYADMVSADFNRYFSEITDYFVCMDATRQAVFERAREVSKGIRNSGNARMNWG